MQHTGPLDPASLMDSLTRPSTHLQAHSEACLGLIQCLMHGNKGPTALCIAPALVLSSTVMFFPHFNCLLDCFPVLDELD